MTVKLTIQIIWLSRLFLNNNLAKTDTDRLPTVSLFSDNMLTLSLPH